MKQVTDWRKNVAGYFVLDAEKDVINAVYLSEVGPHRQSRHARCDCGLFAT